MIDEYLKLGWNNLLKRKLRSWLTMLGIFIGIAAIVSLISLGQGLQESIEGEFEKVGTDKIIIQPRGNLGGIGDISSAKLTDDDLDTIESTLGVDEAAGMLTKSIKVEYEDQVRFMMAVGTPTGADMELVKEVMYFEIDSGRDLENRDRRKVVLGSMFYDGDLFDPNVKLRDKIKLNDEDFKVVGFYESIGSAADDSTVFMTEDAMRELYDLDDEWAMIFARVNQDPEIVADRVKKNLRSERNVEEGKEDFTVTTAEEFISAFGTILDILNIFLVGIASISLLVGGIGIMNTMYTAVIERTQEIGVMKAIGARNSAIATIFLLESGLLGMAGGAIGITLGIAIAQFVEYIIAQAGYSIIQASTPPWLIIGALLFSFIIGTISGVLPAYRASKLEPTTALRYE